MKKISAGILLYRLSPDGVQVFLVHPGGPFWEGKDLGAWSLPKGLAEEGEDLLGAAQREFNEETGSIADGIFIPLTPVKTGSGKCIHAFALEGDCDPSTIQSNSFSMEWPPRSRKHRDFPEVDRAGWFGLQAARLKIHRSQAGLIDELEYILSRK